MMHDNKVQNEHIYRLSLVRCFICIFLVFFLYILVSQGSWVRYPVWPHTFVSPSAFSRRAGVSYWRKYVHEVLVNHLGGLNLPRKSVVRLTGRPDITLDVYRGRKTTIQRYNNNRFFLIAVLYNLKQIFNPCAVKDKKIWP